MSDTPPKEPAGSGQTSEEGGKETDNSGDKPQASMTLIEDRKPKDAVREDDKPSGMDTPHKKNPATIKKVRGVAAIWLALSKVPPLAYLSIYVFLIPIFAGFDTYRLEDGFYAPYGQLERPC